MNNPVELPSLEGDRKAGTTTVTGVDSLDISKSTNGIITTTVKC